AATANFSSGEPINTTNLSLTSGFLSGTDVVTASGASTWNGGTMTGAGTTTINGNLGIGTTALKDLSGGRHLNTNGTTTWTGTADIRTGQNGAIVNGGTWDIQNNQAINLSFTGTASFTNNGTVRKSAGAGVTSFLPAFNNNTGGLADITISSGT